MLGAGAYPARPSIAAGTFAKHTRLRVVTYEGDGFILTEDSRGLYRYLTGDESDACFVPLTDPETVHATHISHPQRLIAALEAADRCKYHKGGGGHGGHGGHH